MVVCLCYFEKCFNVVGLYKKTLILIVFICKWQLGLLQIMNQNKLESGKQLNFTPNLDLKLLWTKHYYPQSSWVQIAHILKLQFQLEMAPQILKRRYEEYLNIPTAKIKAFQDQNRQKQYDFIEAETRKNPGQFLEMYREIKKYHQETNKTKRSETYEKQIIKKQLYPDFEDNITQSEIRAVKEAGITNIEEEYDLLRYRDTSELSEDEATRLQKIQKIKFRIKQMRLQNQRRVSKLYRVVRGIIAVQSKHFAHEIIINQISISKYLIKVLKNIYQNVQKVYVQLQSQTYKINARQTSLGDRGNGKSNNFANLNKNAYQINKSATSRFNSRGREEIIVDDKHQTPNFGKLALQSFQNIERAYEEGQTLYRKQIIKVYYFPNTSKTQEKSQTIYQTPDGQKVSEKGLILILKMMKKIEFNYLKQKHQTEHQLMAQIADIQGLHFPSERSVSDTKMDNQLYLKNTQIKTPINSNSTPSQKDIIIGSQATITSTYTKDPPFAKTNPAINQELRSSDMRISKLESMKRPMQRQNYEQEQVKHFMKRHKHQLMQPPSSQINSVINVPSKMEKGKIKKEGKRAQQNASYSPIHKLQQSLEEEEKLRNRLISMPIVKQDLLLLHGEPKSLAQYNRDSPNKNKPIRKVKDKHEKNTKKKETDKQDFILPVQSFQLPFESPFGESDQVDLAKNSKERKKYTKKNQKKQTVQQQIPDSGAKIKKKRTKKQKESQQKLNKVPQQKQKQVKMMKWPKPKQIKQILPNSPNSRLLSMFQAQMQQKSTGPIQPNQQKIRMDPLKVSLSYLNKYKQ